MSSHDADHRTMAPPRVEEVAAGIYAYVQPDGSWWINNAGFVVGGQSVMCVDSCSTERRTRGYLAAIASVTDRPVRTLINTHHHGDHTHGNYLFSAATIVAHELCRREVMASIIPPPPGLWTEVEWGAIARSAPFLTFTDGVTVYVDDLACEVRHVGTPAHTTNDSIVWIPERSVLFSGDLLFNRGTPFLLMGSISGAIEVLEDVLRPLGAKIIVPGHGDVCGPEVIDDVLGYLHFVQETASAGVKAGLSPLDASREADLGPYASLMDTERIVGNLHRAYSELAGGARGEPIDVASALLDMVTYNGGRPLSCFA